LRVRLGPAGSELLGKVGEEMIAGSVNFGENVAQCMENRTFVPTPAWIMCLKDEELAGLVVRSVKKLRGL